MEFALELLKILLPCAATVIAVYFVIDRLLKEREHSASEKVKVEEIKVMLPLMLQAYERMNLFLERIAVENIIIRLHQPTGSAHELHTTLVKAVNEEFEHNIAQQIYVSEEGWKAVREAKDEVIRVVNRAMGQLPANGTSLDLSQKVFELMSEMEEPATHRARRVLKGELNTRLKYY